MSEPAATDQPAEDAGATTDSSTTGAPEWYCPACGARYQAAGTCTNNHPAEDLVHDDAMGNDSASVEASPLADDPAVDAGSEEPEAATATEQAPEPPSASAADAVESSTVSTSPDEPPAAAPQPEQEPEQADDAEHVKNTIASLLDHAAALLKKL